MNTFYALFFLLHASGIEGAAINVEGFVGGDVSFQCSHKFASKITKYFCKAACKGIEDRLVTVQSGATAESGRITLVDSGAGAFSVTFRQLQLSDMGGYWCGVERIGFNTYTSVQLTVNEGVTNEIRTVKPELSHTWTYENMSNSTQLTSVMDSSNPAILSAATNNSNGGEQNVSTGNVERLQNLNHEFASTAQTSSVQTKESRPTVRTMKLLSQGSR
ncbi:CMRF35-like molecule 9 isoform X3 [Gymnodraco acuticeps]|uniref:CMRF35-like molecule 9 isoform X3 n=1 Tax=Gymnodraco acuticeps TaxID=8218 RepID=A0A6P8VW06_GYMAC|nr:CMRF35-like molecule 9 isoform X3 [Gymnodraco acuticeps]